MVRSYIKFILPWWHKLLKFCSFFVILNLENPWFLIAKLWFEISIMIEWLGVVLTKLTNCKIIRKVVITTNAHFPGALMNSRRVMKSKYKFWGGFKWKGTPVLFYFRCIFFFLPKLKGRFVWAGGGWIYARGGNPIPWRDFHGPTLIQILFSFFLYLGSFLSISSTLPIAFVLR